MFPLRNYKNWQRAACTLVRKEREQEQESVKVSGKGVRRGGRASSTPKKSKNRPQDDVTFNSGSENPSCITLESLRSLGVPETAGGLDVTEVARQEELGPEEQLELELEQDPELEVEDEQRLEQVEGLELEQELDEQEDTTKKVLKQIRHNVRAISTPEQNKISKMGDVTFDQKSGKLSSIMLDSMISDVISESEEDTLV